MSDAATFPFDWRAGDFVQFASTNGSVGQILDIDTRAEVVTVEWVYGRDRRGEVMRAVSRFYGFRAKYELVRSSKEDYERMRDRKGFAS